MNWRNKTLLIGAVAGVVVGLVGAYIVIQRSEELNNLPELTPADGVKVGLGLLGVLRLVAEIAERN